MAIPVTTLTDYYYPELPDYLQSIDDLSALLMATAPDVWASAGLFDITKFEQLLNKLESSKGRQQRQKSLEGRRDTFATSLASMMSNF